MALDQLTRLSGMVEQILAMSMERRSTIALDSEKIALKPFLEEIAGAQRLRAQKPTSVHVEVSPASLEVLADPTHLGNVISNLIENAIKYSRDSVEINIRADRGSISVADNGIGIPAKSLPLISNKFYRVPTGDRQDVRGLRHRSVLCPRHRGKNGMEHKRRFNTRQGFPDFSHILQHISARQSCRRN